MSDRWSRNLKRASAVLLALAMGTAALPNALPAYAAGEAIDTSNMPHIKGSLAGDNTLLLIADDPKNVPAIIEEFNNMLYTRTKND